MSDLTSMMNIGIEMKNELISVGIESSEKLIEVGAKDPSDVIYFKHK